MILNPQISNPQNNYVDLTKVVRITMPYTYNRLQTINFQYQDGSIEIWLYSSIGDFATDYNYLLHNKVIVASDSVISCQYFGF